MNTDNVATLASLELDMMSTKQLQAEDEVLHLKKSAEACVKTLSELMAQVGAAAKDP